MNPPNHMKQLEDVQDFPCILECRFCMDDENEKLRMKEATNKLASLISSLDLGSVQMRV